MTILLKNNNHLSKLFLASLLIISCITLSYSQEAKIKISDDFIYRKVLDKVEIKGVDSLLSSKEKAPVDNMYRSYGRTKTEISKDMVQNLVTIKETYNRYLAHYADLSGRIETKFTIYSDGSVKDVEILESTVNNDLFEKSIAICISSLKFTEIKRPHYEGTKVVYPFIFTPDGQRHRLEPQDSIEIGQMLTNIFSVFSIPDSLVFSRLAKDSLFCIPCEWGQGPYVISTKTSSQTFFNLYMGFITKSETWQKVLQARHRAFADRSDSTSTKIDVIFITWAPNEYHEGHGGASLSLHFEKVNDVFLFAGITTTP